MLKLGHRVYEDELPLVMAIVNRTPDSFYDRGATYAEDAALERVAQVVADGADLVDIGGVKAGYGAYVSAQEEIDRVGAFVGRVRAAHPDLVISVDTWRSEVARVVLSEGADVLNDAWGGHDPTLVDVAGEFDAAIICTHTGGLAPRTDPHRPAYDDVMAAAIADTLAYADRALAAGVRKESVVIDPAHDFGKNTWHSLEVTRRLGELTTLGWPVLVSLSNKDFVGEALDLPVGERLTGTLAATALCAWHGAQVYRVHEVVETRQVLDLVSVVAGDMRPARTTRGLA